MDRGAWWALVHGVARVGHDLATKPPTIVALVVLASAYSKVNQPYIYISPLFFGFPSHLGHHRSLTRVPWAIQ